MAQGAAAAGGGGGGAAMAGGNPFQLATNLYAEKNQQGITTNLTTGASQTPGGGAVNSGQFLRSVRLIFRTSTAGTVATGATVSDMPWNIFTGVDLVNVDGSEILYTMGGYAHYLAQKYGRPWLGDPATYQDAAVSTVLVPQFTLSLQPEIRWSAGVLANTDTRSAYRFDYTVDTETNFLQGGTGYTVHPVFNVTPYMDAWAQADASDLQGTPNQPIPPGLNLLVKRRPDRHAERGWVGQHHPVRPHRQRAALPDPRHPRRVPVCAGRRPHRPDPVAQRQPVPRQVLHQPAPDRRDRHVQPRR